MNGDEEYEQTVEALRNGAKLPDVRRDPPRPPSAAVLIVFAMVGMFALVNAAEAWPMVAEAFPLLSMAYFLVLATWASSGRPRR